VAAVVTDELAPVSAIADVLALWGVDGWLTPPLAPVVGSSSVRCGRALTVQVGAGADGPGFTGIYDLLSGDLAGRVVVIAGARAVPGAVFGEILAAAAAQCGAVGVLVDGWVRDRGDMTAIGLPVLAAGERVVGPNGAAHLTGVDVDVLIAVPDAPGSDDRSVVVTCHDLIVIDPSGAVRVPADIADQVLEGARRYAAAEGLVAAALADGEPLTAAYRHKKAVVAELRGSTPALAARREGGR
jgi:regulator of RNase E activity RraA